MILQFKKQGLLLPVLGLAALYSTSAFAVDFSDTQLSLSTGVVSLDANEIVWYDLSANEKASQLDWETYAAPIMTIDLSTKIDQTYTLSTQFSFATSGNSNMVDTDWAWYWSTTDDESMWSHQSKSPDTELNSYIDIDVSLGRDFVLANGAVRLTPQLGLHYTSTDWSAYGGSYIYSPEFILDEDDNITNLDEFRNDRGDFADGEKGVSYKQAYLSPYLGLNTQKTFGKNTFNVGTKIGLSADVNAIDHHHLRDFFSTVDFNNMAIYGAASLGYQHQFNEHLSFVANLEMQVYSRELGDSTYEYADGSATEYYPDTESTDLLTKKLTMGLSYSF